MSGKTGLVSITLPQQTYAEFSTYCKSKGYPVRRMMELIVSEAVKRDLYDDIMISAAMARRILDDKINSRGLNKNTVASAKNRLRNWPGCHECVNNSSQSIIDEVDDLVAGIVSGASTEAAATYSGMVADYHRQYIEDITPVDMSGSTGMQSSAEMDIAEILGPGF